VVLRKPWLHTAINQDFAIDEWKERRSHEHKCPCVSAVILFPPRKEVQSTKKYIAAQTPRKEKV
jgi:hypothetical protein